MISGYDRETLVRPSRWERRINSNAVNKIHLTQTIHLTVSKQSGSIRKETMKDKKERPFLFLLIIFPIKDEKGERCK
jgi:hypothetical protein